MVITPYITEGSITTRKRSLRRLCFLHLSVSHSVHRGVVSQHALQMVSQHALQQGGGIQACLAGFQAHTQGEVEGLARGVSRPTPKGEVEGSGWGCLQAHTRGVSPGPHLGVSGTHQGGLQAHTRGVYPSMH